MKLPKIDWEYVVETAVALLLLFITVALPIAVILALLKYVGVIG